MEIEQQHVADICQARRDQKGRDRRILRPAFVLILAMLCAPLAFGLNGAYSP